MLLRADGTLVPVEYEIIDGVMVFVTDEIGVFVLVEAETLEI